MASSFPERVYTSDEVVEARKLIELGYRHKLAIEGTTEFEKKVNKVLEHVETAGFYDFLTTYIRQIVEIDGFSQLRESEVALWITKQLLISPVEAAGFFVQKAFQMKEFLEGKLYYGGAAEARSLKARIRFLKALKKRANNQRVREECRRILKRWADSTFVF